MTADVLAAAIRYVEFYKLSVIPVRPNSKQPAIDWKPFQDRRATAQELEQWFAAGRASVAIVTGKLSGVVALDVDGEAGEASIRDLPVVPTVTVKTPHGLHLIYRYPLGKEVRNTTGLLPHVDVRGDGGIVVAPPSVIDGAAYSFVNPPEDGEFTNRDLPPWYWDLAAEVSRPKTSTHTDEDDLAVVEGERNDWLFREACALRRRGWSVAEMVEGLLIRNREHCDPPLAEDELHQISASAGRYVPEHKTSASHIPAAPEGLGELFISASEVKPEHVRWLWRKWIPFHEVTLLAGVQGRGKSMLLMYFIATVTFGQGPRDVVLLSAEESPETTIVPRLMAAGADLDRVHILKMAEKRFTLPRDVAILEEAVRRWDVGLLVIDPLLSYLDDDTDANSTKEVRSAMHALDFIKAKATVLALIHFRKESAQEVLHQITSSSAFTEVPRAAMGLGKEPDTADDDGRLVLVHLKANLYKIQRSILVQIEQVEVPDPAGGPPFETARAFVGVECEFNKDQVFRPSRSGRPPVAREEAKEFLGLKHREFAGRIPVRATTQEFIAAGLGSEDTLRRAKDDLGYTLERGDDALFYWVGPSF